MKQLRAGSSDGLSDTPKPPPAVYVIVGPAAADEIRGSALRYCKGLVGEELIDVFRIFASKGQGQFRYVPGKAAGAENQRRCVQRDLQGAPPVAQRLIYAAVPSRN